MKFLKWLRMVLAEKLLPYVPDDALFVFAEHRAGITPRNWKAYKNFEQGEWDLGVCTRKEAEQKVTEGGAHKIVYVDFDEATYLISVNNFPIH